MSEALGLIPSKKPKQNKKQRGGKRTKGKWGEEKTEPWKSYVLG